MENGTGRALPDVEMTDLQYVLKAEAVPATRWTEAPRWTHPLASRAKLSASLGEVNIAEHQANMNLR